MQKYLTPKWLLSIAAILFLIFWLIAIYWSFEPATFNPKQTAQEYAQQHNEKIVPGYTLTTSLITVTETLLNKSGGYLSNDVMPPGLFMDNMPSWEFGALEMTRDLALSMRKDISRSQSQSSENPFLTDAQPKLNIDHRSWLLPSAESQYQDAIDKLYQYRASLSTSRQGTGQFYARADNLRDWVKQVEKRLGNLSQKLSVSVGQYRLDTSFAGDSSAGKIPAEELREQTNWFQLDNNFYEARGASWALIHFLKALWLFPIGI